MPRTEQEWRRPLNLPPSHYIDNRMYTGDEIFREELDNIFKKVWTLVCHESEVAEPGDFRTMDLADVPILITRSEDGRIRTFQNTCSHRGATLVEDPSGNALGFTCIFHRWSYDSFGNCIAMTRDEAYEPVKCRPQDVGLREIRTEVRLGLVFINLDDDAESLDDFLGDSLENVEPILSSGPMEVYHYHEQIICANWKHLQEVSSEIYHANMHRMESRETMKQADYHDRAWKLYPNGHMTLMGPFNVNYVGQRGWGRDHQGITMPGLQPREFRVLDLWPNTAMVFRDSAARFDTIVPLSPDRTLLRMRGFGIKGESEEDRLKRYRDHNILWGPFGWNVPEDNAVTLMQQVSNRERRKSYSIIAREEELKPHDEGTLRHYYREWERHVGRSASTLEPLQVAAE